MEIGCLLGQLLALFFKHFRFLVLPNLFRYAFCELNLALLNPTLLILIDCQLIRKLTSTPIDARRRQVTVWLPQVLNIERDRVKRSFHRFENLNLESRDQQACCVLLVISHAPLTSSRRRHEFIDSGCLLAGGLILESQLSHHVFHRLSPAEASWTGTEDFLYWSQK